MRLGRDLLRPVLNDQPKSTGEEMTMEIRIKPSRVRRPARPRTCCPTHNDTCQFGRPHVWCWGNMIDGVWVAESMICGTCGARCVDED